jgi:glutamate N-acetyltransferase / amino-acid N-acetyltransferase
MGYNIIEDGHISTPTGFKATGVSAGLKEVRSRDLAIVISAKPCRVAARFTTNAIPAAPIYFNQAILARSREHIRAVLINAGQANAGTGQPGLANAVECAKLAADELEIPRDSVLLLSTGQIGVHIPIEKMRDGIRRAASELDSGAGRRAALAILTSDTKPKDRALRVGLREGHTITLAGMAKGGRMVHPRLATMLAVITTDAPIDLRLLSRSLDHSVAKSFGRLSIDGDTSPNDGVLVLANGAAGVAPINDAGSWEFGAWQEALDGLCQDLAQQIIRDAANTTRFVQVHVRGANSDEDAQRVAHTVARSESVRWAITRGTPDWGSIMVAVGASGADIRPDVLEIRIGSLLVMDDGTATRLDATALTQVFSQPEVELTIDLHTGTGLATVWTCTSMGDTP